MNQTNFKSLLRHMVYAAVCLALCMVLPFLTGQIPQIGSALSPMHIPVLLAGFLCGPWWAMAVGFAAPMLRHVWMGMPPLITAIAMSFELAGYGLFSGLLYRLLPKKTVNIYVSLIGAMILGRIIWGIAMVVISGVTGSAFTWSAFMAGALLNAIPGIILHIVLIPILVMALKRAKVLDACLISGVTPVFPECVGSRRSSCVCRSDRWYFCVLPACAAGTLPGIHFA